MKQKILDILAIQKKAVSYSYLKEELHIETKVAFAIIFSGPRSLTLVNRLSPLPPVKAPLIPSDLPLCNNVSKMIRIATINKIMSNMGYTPL